MIQATDRNATPSVLFVRIIDGELPFGSFLPIATDRFRAWGYRTEVVANNRDLSTSLNCLSPDLVVLDIGNSVEGLGTLKQLATSNRTLPVIVMSSEVSIALAVQATKMGAIDVIPNPPDLHQLRIIVDGVVKERVARRRTIDSDAARGCDDFKMLGQSQAILDVLDLIEDVAETDATVLILGESGTGKELLARAIHACSRRSKQSFVPVNVATLPATIAESILFGHERGAFTGADSANKGWCETASGGTLMLDEIGEMDILLQAKLLRFLQDGTFMRVGASKSQTADVRVVAATNRNPEQLVRENKMREDLYYRLNVFPIRMPPLRERREDIPILANSFLDLSAELHRRHVVGFSEEAMSCLMNYDWPGNVRQLENLVTRMVLLAREPYIGISNVPIEIRSLVNRRPISVGQCANVDLDTANHSATGDVNGLSQMEQVEKQAIIKSLCDTNGNAVAAARLLGVGQATIYRKIKRFNIELKHLKSSNMTN